jgi:hypothetical protein
VGLAKYGGGKPKGRQEEDEGDAQIHPGRVTGVKAQNEAEGRCGQGGDVQGFGCR